MATSNILQTVGAVKKWKNTGADGVFTFTSVANAAGRLGQRVDLGDLLAANTAARAGWYRWYLKLQFVSSGLVIGNTADLYFAGWNDDGTPANPDGGVGASDAAFSTAALLNNLKLAGSVIVDSTAGATDFVNSGLIFIPKRHVSPVVFNNTGAAASATATVHEIWLTPFNPQAQ